MEILYLYFLQSPEVRIGNQDINFGGQYRFTYNNEHKQLTVSENHYFIDDFFSLRTNSEDSAKISNVTSIIGENGSGKSSLLRLIKSNFADGSAGIRNPLIVALKSGGRIIVYHFEEIGIKKHNLDAFEIQLEKLIVENKKINRSGKAFKYTVYPKIDGFRNTDFISFSNVFDGEPEVDLKGSYEISTNALIVNDYKRSVENQLINSEINPKQIEIHLYEEIERQIAFTNRYSHEKFIPFELPDYIYLTSKKEIDYDFGYSRQEKAILEEYGSMDDFLSLVLLLKEILKKQKGKEKIQNYFIASCLLNFFLELATHYRAISVHVRFKINFSVIRDLESITEITLKLLDEVENESKSLNVSMDDSHYEWIEGVRGFVKVLPGLVAKNDQSIEDLNMLALEVTGSSRNEFKNFYDSYRKSYRLKPFVNFKWRSLSTGEKALFNIYSRFYSLSNNEAINELNKSVIILIDEGDVYLHPAWQKKFVYLLLDYLTRVYSRMRSGENRSIQLILTTNSPIPASDLPNDNTIFLEKATFYSKDKLDFITSVTVKDSLNDKKETFAANIYTLFSDSFFIKDGLIGDFAVYKINSIISQLSKGLKPDKKSREEIRKIIHQIGEPILKHKLMQLYNDRFNLDIHERLDNIENRLGI